MRPTLTTQSPDFISRSQPLATEFVVYTDALDASDNDRRPAIVVLDGDYFFDAAAHAARSLRAEGAIPPVLVVGIGYGRPFGHPDNRRGRDCTPTASIEEPGSGGAAAFRTHLETRIWPELLRRHPIDVERSVLAGHSLSALFVLFAMFQTHPLWTRAIVGAPSIWWDNRSVLAHIAAIRDARDSLPAEIFVGVGENETPSMLGDLALFDEQMTARPFADLHLTTRRFPGRDHYNLLPDLFRTGLQEMLGG